MRGLTTGLLCAIQKELLGADVDGGQEKKCQCCERVPVGCNYSNEPYEIVIEQYYG